MIWWRNTQCMRHAAPPWASSVIIFIRCCDACVRRRVMSLRRLWRSSRTLISCRWFDRMLSSHCFIASSSFTGGSSILCKHNYHWLEDWSHKNFRNMLTPYEIRNNVDCDSKKKHFHTVFLSVLLFLGSLGFELSSNFWNRHREHLQCLTTTCIFTVDIHTVFAYITFEALPYLPQYLSVFCPWDCVWSCSVHWFHQSVPLQTQIRFVLRFSTWVK